MNWIELIEDLKTAHRARTGKVLSDQMIANMVGCKRNTITSLRAGKTSEPGYSVGANLVRLHTPEVSGGYREGFRDGWVARGDCDE